MAKAQTARPATEDQEQEKRSLVTQVCLGRKKLKDQEKLLKDGPEAQLKDLLEPKEAIVVPHHPVLGRHGLRLDPITKKVHSEDLLRKEGKLTEYRRAKKELEKAEAAMSRFDDCVVKEPTGSYKLQPVKSA